MGVSATKTPLMFALIGTGTLMLISGMKGVSIADVVTGKANDKHLDPAGGQGDSPDDGDGALSSVTDGITNALKGVADASGTAFNDFSTSAKGVGTFEGMRVANWIIPYLKYGRQHGWKGRVTSGYRTYADQLRIWNSGVRPAARPGTSNHEGANFPRGAVDVEDAATLDRILRAKPGGSRLKWAGAKDPVHFSFPHNGSY